MYIRKMTCCLGEISNMITGNAGDVPIHLASRTGHREQKRPQHCLPGTFGIQGASEHHRWVSSYGRRVASLVMTYGQSSVSVAQMISVNKGRGLLEYAFAGEPGLQNCALISGEKKKKKTHCLSNCLCLSPSLASSNRQIPAHLHSRSVNTSCKSTAVSLRRVDCFGHPCAR